MTKKPKSYDEFYFNKKKQILDLQILIDYYEENGNFDRYDGNIFCPECREASLTFVPEYSATAHLKRKQSSRHSNDCPYQYNYASNNQVTKYVKSLGYQQVQHKLNSILRFLHRRENQQMHNFSPQNSKITSYPFTFESTKNKDTSHQLLRKKKLNQHLDKSLVNDIYVFYGNVKLNISSFDKEEKTYYNLLLYTQNKYNEWVYKTKVFRYTIQDNIVEDKVYQIALIGKLDFYKESKWPQIKLLNNDAFKYQAIENERN